MIEVRRKLQLIPHDVHDAGFEFGEAMRAHYANGGSPQSRARSGNRGTESNVRRLAQGKIGEAAVALFLGLDAWTAVNWSVARPDVGTDVIGPHGVRIDAKTNFPHLPLIWSRDVNDLYDQKAFDVLLSVSIEPDDFHRCWIEGFLSKKEFKRQHLVAGENSRLQVDTWFFPKDELWNVVALDGFARRFKNGGMRNG